MNEDFRGVIGIDLGSSVCRVAVYNQGHVEIIAAIPYIVSFPSSSSKPIIGEGENSVNGVVRVLGKKFAHFCGKSPAETIHFPFKITNNNELANIQLSEGLEFAPEEITAIVLVKLKQKAEAYLGERVKRAVISVPSMFGDAQRRAVKNAATIAGLDAIRITTDIICTGITYSREYPRRERHVLVLDFGATSVKAATMVIDEGIVEIRIVAGSNSIGGVDMDRKLVEYCVGELKKHNVDVQLSPQAMEKLRVACEKAKIQLSSSSSTTITANAVMEGIDLNLKLTRQMFEELNNDLFQAAVKYVSQVLTCHVDPIRDVVIVGGSSKIPKVQQMIRELLDGKELNTSFNNGESVAQGVAVYAAMLAGEPMDTLTLDVYPYAIGIDQTSGHLHILIVRSTTIPCKKIQVFTTYRDNCCEMSCSVYEGTKQLTKDNELVGSFGLSGIHPAPRGVPQIEISFMIDANGFIDLFACDKNLSKHGPMSVTRQHPHLSHQQVEEMRKRIEELMK